MTGDELWLAVKFQTNLEIAGSPRNSFRASVEKEFRGGKALNGLGGDKLTEPYQTKNAAEMLFRSQTAQPGCWLRGSHSFKECVIAHWSSDLARKI